MHASRVLDCVTFFSPGIVADSEHFDRAFGHVWVFTGVVKDLEHSAASHD